MSKQARKNFVTRSSEENDDKTGYKANPIDFRCSGRHPSCSPGKVLGPLHGQLRVRSSSDVASITYIHTHIDIYVPNIYIYVFIKIE